VNEPNALHSNVGMYRYLCGVDLMAWHVELKQFIPTQIYSFTSEMHMHDYIIIDDTVQMQVTVVDGGDGGVGCKCHENE